MKKQLNFHRLMVMLLVFDTMLVFVNMLLFVTPYLSSRFKDQILAYIQTVAIPVVQISMTGSIYSTLAISIERYMIACKPFYMNSHKWSVKRYIIPIVVFSVTYNMPKFFEIETCIDTPPDNLNNSEHTFGLKATSLRSNPNYYITYTIWANFILMGFLPFMILIVVNGLTFKSLIAQIPNIKRVSAVPKSIQSTSTSCHNTSLKGKAPKSLDGNNQRLTPHREGQ